MKKRSTILSALFFCSLQATASQTIAVVGAMDVEIASLIPAIENLQETQLRNHTFYIGTIHGQDVVVTKSGVGKVSAAVVTTELIREFGADQLIFTGIAGAADPELEPEDVVISTALVQHDVDVTFNYEPGQVHGFDDRNFYADESLVQIAYSAAQATANDKQVYQGIIATGDQFIADQQTVAGIHQQFDAMAVEMEGAAVAQVAAMFDRPLVVIRTISDKADGSAHLSYDDMERVAAENSSAITLNMLKQMAN